MIGLTYMFKLKASDGKCGVSIRRRPYAPAETSILQTNIARSLALQFTPTQGLPSLKLVTDFPGK